MTLSAAVSADAGERNRLEDEAVAYAADLIRIDTTNTGDPATTVGEREAAEYVVARLVDAGYEVETYAPQDKRRVSVIARYRSEAPIRSPLLVHGHLDVVPADPDEWSVPPFSGEIRDGYIWGRGAVDMKGMVGMMLALARSLRRTRARLDRDIVFAFFADEEAGGTHGSGWLVDNHPEAFAGVEEAIGEAGGFSVELDSGHRVYLVQAAEKGKRWLTLRANGNPGHGSMLHQGNAITDLGTALGRIGNHEFPATPTRTVTELLRRLSEITGQQYGYDDVDDWLGSLGPVAPIIGATVRETVEPTVLRAGYKANVIPSQAEAQIDCRVLPGRSDALTRELADVLGDNIEMHWHEQDALETSFDGDLADAMTQALLAEDPDAHVVPYMFSAATDAKRLARLGIRCFGFTPLRLPPDLAFASLFHGIDERVPVDAIRFGVRVLDRFLRAA